MTWLHGQSLTQNLKKRLHNSQQLLPIMRYFHNMLIGIGEILHKLIGIKFLISTYFLHLHHARIFLMLVCKEVSRKAHGQDRLSFGVYMIV